MNIDKAVMYLIYPVVIVVAVWIIVTVVHNT